VQKTQADEKVKGLQSSLEQSKHAFADIEKRLTQENAELLAQKTKVEEQLNVIHISLEEDKRQTELLAVEKGKLISDNLSLVSEKDKCLAQLAELDNKFKKLGVDKASLDAEFKALSAKFNQQQESMLELQSKLLVAQEKINEKLELQGAEQLKSTLDEVIKIKNGLNWRMDKGHLNVVKQIESFIGLEASLNNGSTALEYHGWPISSDIALFLLNKIQQNNYDLIIEFGSGTSTVLFGRAVQGTKQMSDNLKELPLKSGREQNFKISPAEYDLPKRVLTFEHNKKYFDKTTQSIIQQGIQDVVEIVHAPLVDYTLGEEHYLYYSCEESLKKIGSLFEGRTAKILVLVDGPPAATGLLARLPAIPHLLNTLGKHQLDLVLDDFNREEEKNIAERWKVMLKDRFISYEEELIPCEKGAWFCRIN
jgi:hypothetical protein